MSWHLIEALEDLRERIGKPVRIISGYRCPEYNRRVGGAPRSQHLLGRAADVRVLGLPDFGIHEIVDAIYADKLYFYPFARGGIGVYTEQNFVHLDVRGEYGGRTARWHGK